MSTLTDVITALKGHAPLSALHGGRVYTDVPENPTLPYIKLVLIGGPPFQNGAGRVIATMERFRVICWGNDASTVEGMKVPVQDALITLWGDYEVQLLEPHSEQDPKTRLFWRSQDVRLIGCV